MGGGGRERERERGKGQGVGFIGTLLYLHQVARLKCTLLMIRDQAGEHESQPYKLKSQASDA